VTYKVVALLLEKTYVLDTGNGAFHMAAKADNVVISCRLPREIYDKLLRLKRKPEWSLNHFVNKLIEQGLQSNENKINHVG
jgi:hypothetical protein